MLANKVSEDDLKMRYKDNEFPEKYVPTLVENYTKEIILNDSKIYVNLWDTAG